MTLTTRTKIAGKSQTYKGDSEETTDPTLLAAEDLKASVGLPRTEDAVYMTFSAAMFMLVAAATLGWWGVSSWGVLGADGAVLVGLVASIGPVIGKCACTR